MTTNEHLKVGEIRPSQLLFTHGVGALIDLPHLSVIVTGLDDWQLKIDNMLPITEERLLRTVQSQMGDQVQQLLAPPMASTEKGDDYIGVPVALFPRWMFCPACQRLAPLSSGLFLRRIDNYHTDRICHIHANCAKASQPKVVPARFLVACPNGHLDDFPWIEFVHGGKTDCNALLRLKEYGPSGEARDLMVHCDMCQKSRSLIEAFVKDGRTRMPRCRGRRPHLRDYEDTSCEATSTTILIGASNLWFPDIVTTLAIPSPALGLRQLIDDDWAKLKAVESEQNIDLLRGFRQLTNFTEYTSAEIWQAIVHKREQEETGIPDDPTDVKTPEWDILSDKEQQLSSSDFRLREVAVPNGFTDQIARVVLVERLREVRALIGFTRIDAPGEMGDGPGAAQARRVPLSHHDLKWVPAAEVRGEGIFIQFREEAIQQWLAQDVVQQRADQFHQSYRRWQHARGINTDADHDPGMRYVLLHTFAHALMRRFVLECGYTAASIRERLYSRNVNESDIHPEPMAGVLIYTAAPDSDGTLGGLVTLRTD